MIVSEKGMPIGWAHLGVELRYAWLSSNVNIDWVNSPHIKESNLYLYKTKNHKGETSVLIKPHESIDCERFITSVNMIDKIIDHSWDAGNHIVKLYDTKDHEW